MTLSTRQLAVLAALTLVWGINWPVMKLGVSGPPEAPQAYPPLTFRALSMWFGLPVLALVLHVLKVPFRVPRAHWRELLALSVPNMLVWHVVLIVSLQALSSGRAAILGYTMPVFSALWGVAVFGERLALRQWLGVAAAALGVALLLAHELSRLAGAPLAAGAVLGAACAWAYGTHRLRRSAIPVPILAVSFWMTVLTAAVVTALAVVLEGTRWRVPPPHVAWPVAFNALLVFGFAQAAWLYLARSLPPVASTISVMLIPVLGVFSGALWLGEPLHWQDHAAVVSIVLAIGIILWPKRP